MTGSLFPTIPQPVRPLREYQSQAIDLLRDSLRAGNKRVVMQAPTGWGKCLGAGTPVLMFDGHVKLVETIVPGELLMGPDSRPRSVLSVCHGRENLYRVVPVKGDPYVVNESHILSLVMTGGSGARSSKIVNISVLDYLNESQTFRHCAKGWRAPVYFWIRPPLRVAPYFLGLWLGDGSSNHTEICTGDPEIVEYLRQYAGGLGLGLNDRDNSPGSRMFSLVGTGSGNPILVGLQSYGLIRNKHVPHDFKVASRADRLLFLAGIIDSDGSLRPGGGYDLTLKSENLLDDVIFIARSLGFSAYKAESRKTCTNTGVTGDYWRCTISGELDSIPCLIERKKAAPRRQKKNPLRVGIRVEPAGYGEYFGFEIDGDGLFLLGDFTVTHNTRMAGELFVLAREKGRRTVFTVPRIDLVDQTLESFVRDGLSDIGVIQAKHRETDWSRPVQIASVQTMARRGYPEADLVIIDECHMAFDSVHKWMAERPDLTFIGLSATPWTKGLGKHWQDLVISATTETLIEQGFLSTFRVFAPSHPDLEGVKTVAGDYHEGQLAGAMNKAPLVANIVETWILRGEGRPTLCFAVNRAHAKQLQEQFEQAGIPCGYQDARTPGDEREEIRRNFATGRYQVVVNIGTLTTGIDWDVRCIILARPTKSEILYVQMIGRGLRTADGKADCLILDHSDTTLRLGFVTDIKHEVLDDGKERAKAAEDSKDRERLPKECPQCAYLKPAGVTTCPSCGFTTAPPRLKNESGDLVELTARHKPVGSLRCNGKSITLRGLEIPLRQFYGELLGYAEDRGYSMGWAAHKYKEATGNWPNSFRGEEAVDTSFEVASWVKSRMIAWAKSRGKADGGLLTGTDS